jgi:hypothetical protein
MGNHSVHLPVNRQLNFIPDQYLSTQATRDTNVINTLTANVSNPFAGLIPGTGLNGAVVQLQQLLEAYPQFTGVTRQNQDVGSSYFHAFQARAEKRFTRGFQAIVNYQFSKLIQKRSYLNAGDPLLNKVISADDRPQRLAVSARWDLPFGRGRAFGAGSDALLDRIIGGWTVNGIYTLQSGAPLSWSNVVYLGGDLHMNPRGVNGAFDTTRFNRVSAQQPSLNLRTIPTSFGNLREDGINSMDFSILKDIRIKDRLSLQYRCEFFNFLNHPLFDTPNLSPTSTGFGLITSQTNLSRRTQMALRLVW